MNGETTVLTKPPPQCQYFLMSYSFIGSAMERVVLNALAGALRLCRLILLRLRRFICHRLRRSRSTYTNGSMTQGHSRALAHKPAATDLKSASFWSFSANGACSFKPGATSQVTTKFQPQALKVRINVKLTSIPHIALVELNAVLAQQFAVFLLKGASTMVFLLPVDILHHGVQLARAHRKRGIPALPKKAAIPSI